MTTFFLDLIQDLREKKLLPVAAALLVAIIAAPIVLAGGGSKGDDSATPVAGAATADAKASEQKRIAMMISSGGEIPEGSGSDLDAYKSKNPFEPEGGFAKEEKEGGDGSATTKEETQETAKPDSSSGGKSEDNSSGGGSTGGGGSGGGTTDAPTTIIQAPAAPRSTARYTYVADVTFAVNDDSKHIKSLRRLRALPSSSNPQLIFLGSSEKGNAAFLVDAGLREAGEGKCEPTGPTCKILYLGAGAEHSFATADGTTYTIRVNEIRKTKVRKPSAQKAKKAKASSHRKHAVTAVDLIDIEESR